MRNAIRAQLPRRPLDKPGVPVSRIVRSYYGTRFALLATLFALASCQQTADADATSTDKDAIANPSALPGKPPGNLALNSGTSASSSSDIDIAIERTSFAVSPLSKPQFLPVDDAFRLELVNGEQGVELVWIIAPDYYLYKHKFKIDAQAGGHKPVELTDIASFSQGLRKTDDYFGRVEVFYHQALAKIPATGLVALRDAQTPASLTVQYQGCADAGLCYPVQTRTLKLPQ